MSWFGFWISLVLWYGIDTWLFHQGYDTWFHKHKTKEEFELQQLAIAERRKRTQ